MASKLLVINSGSSSLKFKVFERLSSGLTAAVGGIVERIGDVANSALIASRSEGHGKETIKEPVKNHTDALDVVLDFLSHNLSRSFHDEVQAIGHRVVHGMEVAQPVLLDDNILRIIEHASRLAPLHNPPNLEGIYAAQKIFGNKPQVAVFDTAFHQTMPPAAYTYALPLQYRREGGVRKYGFHGTSYKFLVGRAAAALGRPESELNLIIGHIGAGASMTAVRGGLSVDTTMGLTPLEGLVMNTRCGDLDPAVVLYMQDTFGLSTTQADAVLNKKSGLLGLTGMADLRAILELASGGDADSQLALQVYVHRIRRYLGAYLLQLGGSVHAIVFSAGVGENSAEIRSLVLKDLQAFGIEVDEAKNAQTVGGKTGEIQSAASKIRVLVIPTDEELSIAEQTLEVVERTPAPAASAA